MNYFTEIFRLFFPERCAACGEMLPEGTVFLCPHCRWDMPLTGYWREHDNPVARKFWGLVPVTEASALIFFVNGSRYRDMIHGFKYRGQWRVCQQLGEMFGEKLRSGGLYDTVDLVVPVPLHRRRRFTRGYNQSEYLAWGIAEVLGKETDCRTLERRRYNTSQAQTEDKNQRWENVKGIFGVSHPKRFAGRHILLVDDVLTTGATLISCIETLLHTVPSCRVSVVTFAVSAHELFGGQKRGGL